MVLTLYGILNGVLYASLLPLWEGFDEPFHYGYVQSVSRHRALPRLHQSVLSEEIWTSLKLAPASHVVARNIPVVITYREYFALPQVDRATLRSRLKSIPPSLGYRDSMALNYEAQQAPLAYLLLAIPDRLWRETPLLDRIWRLRVLCVTASCLLMAAGTLSLAKGLAVPFRHTLLFLIFSTQMFYASTAHVSNDWLAIPLAVILLAAAVSVYETPGTGSLCLLGFLLAAGLLTKAYFVAFVPLVLALVFYQGASRRLGFRQAAFFATVTALIAAPWYVRNLRLYGTASGMLVAGGVGFEEALRALGGMRWASALMRTARGGLWTGNNSFTTFSVTTLNIMLALLAIAGTIYLAGIRKHSWPGSERVVLVGGLCYGAALVYEVGVSSAFTKGGTLGASAWYVQPMLAPVLWLLSCGLARGRVLGRAVAATMAILWMYVIGATYALKLIPLYGGYEKGRAYLGDLLSWYWQDHRRASDLLDATCLLPSRDLYALTALTMASALGIAIWICRGTAAGSK